MPFSDFKTLNINCNIIQSQEKRAKFLVDKFKPHVIFGEESKLGSEHLSKEIFPPQYFVICKDRKARGGGVFVLV